MSYRGDDLDLRVPTDRSSAPAGHVVDAVPATIRPMFGASARETTIWVDETLLACCNNAFDLALAHGANEVRVEHLIHAFTQVDAAARVLTDCSLNVGRMRRESTVLIVSESPVSFDASRGPPRRSC